MNPPYSISQDYLDPLLYKIFFLLQKKCVRQYRQARTHSWKKRGRRTCPGKRLRIGERFCRTKDPFSGDSERASFTFCFMVFSFSPASSPCKRKPLYACRKCALNYLKFEFACKRGGERAVPCRGDYFVLKACAGGTRPAGVTNRKEGITAC